MKKITTLLFDWLVFLAFLAMYFSPDALANSETGKCKFDREATLSLDLQEFDQSSKGWRKLDKQDGCWAIAADLISDYRKKNDSQSRTLYLHEAQMRAFAEQTEKAIEMLEHIHANEYKKSWQRPWRLYTEATIAFLKKDHKALLEKREELAGIPRPNNFVDSKGNPAPWPPNLNVVDKLIKCFEFSYRQAYKFGCNPESE